MAARPQTPVTCPISSHFANATHRQPSFRQFPCPHSPVNTPACLPERVLQPRIVATLNSGVPSASKRGHRPLGIEVHIGIECRTGHGLRSPASQQFPSPNPSLFLSIRSLGASPPQKKLRNRPISLLTNTCKYVHYYARADTAAPRQTHARTPRIHPPKRRSLRPRRLRGRHLPHPWQPPLRTLLPPHLSPKSTPTLPLSRHLRRASRTGPPTAHRTPTTSRRLSRPPPRRPPPQGNAPPGQTPIPAGRSRLRPSPSRLARHRLPSPRLASNR